MSPSSNTLLLMSYNSELVRLYRALFHTSAFLKEVLAFQMQDILFLESNSTISLACKISVCFFFHCEVAVTCRSHCTVWHCDGPQLTLHLQTTLLKNNLRNPPPTLTPDHIRDTLPSMCTCPMNSLYCCLYWWTSISHCEWSNCCTHCSQS